MRLISSQGSRLVAQSPSGVVALTGASPQTGVGVDVFASTPSELIKEGTLAASVELNIKATSITMTVQWQVSTDAAPTTWLAVKDMNNAAGVTLATGTGSDVDAGPFIVAAPLVVMAFPHCRAVVITGGSATGVAAHDNIKQLQYSFRLKDHVGE